MTPRELAEEVSSLFSLPDLVVRACAVMDSPSSTADDLIEVIELDANLVATVLRLSNSVLYAGRGNIATLHRAVALIGQNAVRDLVLATAAVNTFRDIPEEFVDMDTFWDNSVTCAVLARLIAGRLRVRDAEGLFLAGLLHGVGRLVFYARCPEEYRAALRLAREGSWLLTDAEQAVFGFSHAEVGAALLETWGLPESLTVPVRHQFDPAMAASHPREVAIVHLAADMAAHLAPCLKTNREAETYVPDTRAAASMRTLELNPAALLEITADALAASLEVTEIIHPTSSIIY
ncbi:MAG: putative signal transduction protein [bacterium]|nr:MAG: putative signal transduction protein [bacterium]KAF0148187.1 MAG: putative signal transduction protein [bacterium]KAF0167702.1 MAG: putative signal transduction protein [bacterium]TXT21089.1 MAG: putative signal transduction protein [bacterium]